ALRFFSNSSEIPERLFEYGFRSSSNRLLTLESSTRKLTNIFSGISIITCPITAPRCNHFNINRTLNYSKQRLQPCFQSRRCVFQQRPRDHSQFVHQHGFAACYIFRNGYGVGFDGDEFFWVGYQVEAVRIRFSTQTLWNIDKLQKPRDVSLYRVVQIFARQKVDELIQIRPDQFGMPFRTNAYRPGGSLRRPILTREKYLHQLRKTSGVAADIFDDRFGIRPGMFRRERVANVHIRYLS